MKKQLKILLILNFILFTVSSTAYFTIDLFLKKNNKKEIDDSNIIKSFSPFTKKSGVIVTKALFNENSLINKKIKYDTNDYRVFVSDTKELEIPYKIDQKAGRVYRKIYNGKRLNIAITGVDTRLGERYKNADANHVLSILLDSAKLEIISIPRDAKAFVGEDDTTGLNILSRARGRLGRTRYLEELAKIAEIDKIHKYIEIGFSQSMGIMEFLGYDNAAGTLQVLRSRKDFAAGDYQRVYNQGNFIKGQIIKNWDIVDDTFINILINGVLGLCDTDLNNDDLSKIFNSLKNNGFDPKKDIKLYVKPNFKFRFKEFDFSDDKVVSDLIQKVDKGNDITYKVFEKLLLSIENAKLDSAKRPSLVIRELKNYFDQRAWLQIKDSNERLYIRDNISTLLKDAYLRKNWINKADEITEFIKSEDAFFENTLN